MYRIELRRQAYKDVESISKEYARLIARHIDLLKQNPRLNDSKKLRGEAGFSLRVCTYRVLYDIDDTGKVVTVYRIKHRREAYR